jgi:hypothetical protein
VSRRCDRVGGLGRVCGGTGHGQGAAVGITA